MDKQGSWQEEADKFLKNPPFKRKFKVAPSGSGAGTVVRRRNSKESDFLTSNDRVLRAVFAAFLDLFCNTVPPDRRERVKTEIVTTLVDLRLVPTVYFSDEFSNVRTAFSTLISNVLGNTFLTGPNIDSPLHSGGPSVVVPPTLPSRYRTDFEELEEIGEGGFGTVFKAKCRIDNCCYAIKKIKLKRNLTNFSFRVLSEVQVLASLHHKNVVRYHCGWMEMEPPEFVTSSPGWTGPEPDSQPVSPAVKITEIVDDVVVNGTSKTESDDESTPIPLKLKGLETQRGKGDVEQGEPPGHCDVSTSTSFDPSFSASSDARFRTAVAGGRFWGGSGESTASECETQETSVPSRETDELRDSTDKREGAGSDAGHEVVESSWKPLVYIQMELCSMTLDDYLVKRNREKTFLGTPFVDGAFNRELTIQLLSAIEYIHENRLIHRDIKPSNIFLKHVGPRVRFLLGDFGLACADRNSLDEESNEQPKGKQIVKRHPHRPSLHLTHSRGVGTSTYAAPEQLNSTDYGPMVDIYSAGVVLFEAYSIFTTGMERVQAIEDLRKRRKVPENMREQWPSVSETVLCMTAPSPSRRPSASQLLQRYKTDENKTVSDLREIIREQEKELKALRAELMRVKIENMEKK